MTNPMLLASRKLAGRALSVALLSAFGLVCLASAAWALGELAQKPGTAGCISRDGTGGACQVGRGLEQIYSVAISADGRNVYSTAFVSGAVGIFNRDPITGELRQKGGVAGCISEDGSGGLCRDGTALDGARGLTKSPDGKNVYVASPESDAVAIFDRNPKNGALTQKPGTAGCISEDGSGGACQDGRGLEFASAITTSADGRSVYVATSRSNSVAIFNRNPETGELKQKAGVAGCISDDGSGGLCRDGTALDGAFSVSKSPDGKNLYVSSSRSNAVVIFDRNPKNGALMQKPGTAGCISEDGSGGLCQDATALDHATAIATSPDGRSSYVVSALSDSVGIFNRNPKTGELRQKAGTAGCISEDGSGGLCQDGTALDEAGAVTVSPDGRTVYVGGGLSDAVAIFNRDPKTGALTQKFGTAGCISEDGSGGLCQDGAGLNAPITLATSPDGKNVYVASIVSGALVTLDRRALPVASR